MKTICRPFNMYNNDFEKMWKLLKEDYSQIDDAFVWLFSRFEYWRFGIWHEKKYVPTFWEKNAQLWLNSFGDLLGFAISEEGDETFTIIVKTSYEYLYDEILNWVTENWSKRGRLNIEINSLESWKNSILEKNGFKQKSLTCTTRRYDLEKVIKKEIVMKPNFKIIDMATNPDYVGKLTCTRNAFKNREVIKFDFLVNEYFIQSPSYNPYLDISVVNGEEIHVSSCIGWADYENSVAEIETICTHGDYRRMGFAEAVIKECMRRLHSLGIKYAYITGWNEITNRLYGKIGAESKKEWFRYEII